MPSFSLVPSMCIICQDILDRQELQDRAGLLKESNAAKGKTSLVEEIVEEDLC